MSRVDDVKKMGVGEAVPELIVGSFFPRFEPRLAEIDRGVTFDIWEGGEVTLVMRDRVEVSVVLRGGKESQEVLLELEADELFRANVAVVRRARGIVRIPGQCNFLMEKVNPAAVSMGKAESRSK